MKISIIIPVFNENGVIAECTNSLMKQDYGDFEIIVVDDGSTDNTKYTKIVNYFKDNKSRCFMQDRFYKPNCERYG